MSFIKTVSRNVVLSILGLALMSPAFADVTQSSEGRGVARLEMHISDPGHSTTRFICVGEFGCYNIASANKSLPMESGSIHTLFLTDVRTLRMYPQKMPASCQIRLHGNQTLDVYGKVTVVNSQLALSGLHCRVA